MLRSFRRSSLPAFSAVCLFVACSNDSNDFFGGVSDAGAGGSAGTSSGRGGAASGAGGSSTGGTSAGTSGLPSGGSGPAGGSNAGGTPSTAGSSAAGSGAVSGTAGDAAGEGGDTAQPSGGMAGMPDEVGGAGTGGTTSGGAGAGAAGGTNGGAGAGATGGASGNAGNGATGGGGSSGGGMPGTVCENNNDCESDEYCAKETCAADTGRCAPQPQSCTGSEATFDPVCGCDWMTYYTPCVAAREGVSIRSSGECSGNNQATCNRDDGGDSCSPQRDGARCYRPRTNCEGTSSSMGVCWVLPDECPDEEKVNTYCGGTSGEAECVGLCEVLDREDAVFRDSAACSD